MSHWHTQHNLWNNVTCGNILPTGRRKTVAIFWEILHTVHIKMTLESCLTHNHTHILHTDNRIYCGKILTIGRKHRMNSLNVLRGEKPVLLCLTMHRRKSLKVTFTCAWWNFTKKSSHFNRNPCDWECHMRVKKFTQISLVFKLALTNRKLFGLKMTCWNFTEWHACWTITSFSKLWAWSHSFHSSLTRHTYLLSSSKHLTKQKFTFRADQMYTYDEC